MILRLVTVAGCVSLAVLLVAQLTNAFENSSAESVEEKWSQALTDGSALVVTDRIFERNTRGSDLSAKALPESRVVRSAFWFDTSDQPRSCATVTGNDDVVVQRSTFEPELSELATTYASTSVQSRVKYRPYNLDELRNSLLSQAETQASLQAKAASVDNSIKEGARAIVDEGTPGVRRVALYDGDTGARFATQKWDMSTKGDPVLMYQLVRSVDVVPDPNGDGYKSILALICEAVVGSQNALESSSTATVDADAVGAGTQSSRVITSTTDFTIALEAMSASLGSGYQWQIQWDDAVLDFISASENTSQTGATLCSAVARNASAPAGKEWQGGGAGCLRSSGTLPDAVRLTTITLRCDVLDGSTTELHLVTTEEDPSFGTTFIGPGGAQIETARIDAQITCGVP